MAQETENFVLCQTHEARWTFSCAFTSTLASATRKRTHSRCPFLTASVSGLESNWHAGEVPMGVCS